MSLDDKQYQERDSKRTKKNRQGQVKTLLVTRIT